MRWNAILVLMCLGSFCTGCRPDVVVEIASRIYPDGSIDRQADVTGRDKPTESPSETDGWLQDKTGLILAAPDRWDRVEAGPSTLHAEGIFRLPEDVPPVLAHLDVEGKVPDRQQVRLDRDDLVVLTRWRFQEQFGDPFGQADVNAAVDKILEWVSNYFRDELASMYGSRIDLDGVDRFLQLEAGPITREFLTVRQSAPGIERFESRYHRWRTILERHGAPVVYPENLKPEEAVPDFWELQTDPLLNWSRERLAAAVSTSDETVKPRHLAFIPDALNLEERMEDLLVRQYGSEEAALEEIEPLLRAIEGHYASGGSPRYRFLCRVALPGTVLTTNGTTENGELIWFFRGEELAAGDFILQAESVELNLPALKALSARRSYDAADLMNLVDILGKQDTDDHLKVLLGKAMDAGNLALLEDTEDELPPELQPLALELVEILSRR